MPTKIRAKVPTNSARRGRNFSIVRRSLSRSAECRKRKRPARFPGEPLVSGEPLSLVSLTHNVRPEVTGRIQNVVAARVDTAKMRRFAGIYIILEQPHARWRHGESAARRVNLRCIG